MIKRRSKNFFDFFILFYIVLFVSSVAVAGPVEDADEALKKQPAADPSPPEKGSSDVHIDMNVPPLTYGPLTQNTILQLVIESGGSMEAIRPNWLDSCAYEPVYRLTRPFGTWPAWDYVPSVGEKPLQNRPECTLGQTYRSRIGGMRRLDLMTENETGKMLLENDVLDSDGPGNDDEESNRINTKYGLRKTVFLPTISDNKMGVHSVIEKSPFLKIWEKAYCDAYNSKLDTLIEDLKQPKFGSGRCLEDPQQIYMLFASGDMTPAGYFLGAVARDYDAVAREFYKEFGFTLPLNQPMITPKQCAQKIKFWLWVRQRASELAVLNAKLSREKIKNGLVVGNIHFECEWDYERLAEAYDWVGVSVRPALLPENDDLGRLYWMGYGVKLFGDLTDKPCMISVRSNTLGAGPRVVPSGSSLVYWHNQAVQNGCVGFYLWVNEYPARPGGYKGICYGNPDKSTLPMIRWNTHMRASKQLAHTKVFNPPAAKTAILVSLDSCALKELGAWNRVFSTYIELCRAKVWSGFISDQEIREGSESLSRFTTVYIPSMRFEDESVVKKILEYVRNGGTVVCADPQVFSYNLDGEDISHYRRELFGVRNTKPRPLAEKSVALNDKFSEINIHPYAAGDSLDPDKSASILGKYADGTAAVTQNQYGRGKALLFGAPILDMYSAGIRSFDDIKQREDTSRLDLFKKIEQVSGIEDQSWVWDITIYNLKDVTGWVP